MRPLRICTIIVLISVVLGLPASARAAETRRIDVRLPSKALAEEIAVSVYLPAEYGNPDARFPCLYILEDDLYHRALTGLTDTYARLGKMPGVIVVGIASADRWRDFTPTHAGVPGQEPIPTSGGGDRHREFLVRELVPYIDRTFRTQPYRILTGHSLAGLHALATMFGAPGKFQAFIVTSPSLWWDEEVVTQSAERQLTTESGIDVRLHLATGNEDGTIQDPVDRFCALLEQHPSGGLVWSRTRHDEASHQEVPIRSFCEALDFVYQGWPLPPEAMDQGIAAVDAHYAMLSERYGYDIEVPEHVMNRLGYRALNDGNPHLAVRLFERNVVTYPTSSNVHDSLGEAYLALGREELSQASYERAKALAEAGAATPPAGRKGAACAEEVDRMHAFFADWYRGDRARTAEEFSAFSGALAGDFELITSQGATIDGPTLVELLESEWGTRPDMEMWTDDFRLRFSAGDLHVISYVEHGKDGKHEKVSRITAVLRRSPETRDGLSWVHLHETDINQ